VLLVLSTQPAFAQAVRGDVRDVDRNRPIPGARLLLIDGTGTVVDSTRSDDSAAFRLNAPRPGEYWLYFQMDGWASVTSNRVRVEGDSVTRFPLRVPLVHNSAMRQMGGMMGMDARLRSSLPDLCGEPLRTSDAGLLVGVVRSRATRNPIARARVSVARGRASDAVRSTLTGDNGIYILCNVPIGASVDVVVTAPGGTAREKTQVEIRAGTVSWYDLPIGPRR
ncbi:MAG TPA: carboxypeptidase-like regulatory domain-containing protein, partial [Longimicrobiales bacterium]|nr:carboxypeptidase-like regulatory domain-containing protein [Longimicrobiales bacterium]